LLERFSKKFGITRAPNLRVNNKTFGPRHLRRNQICREIYDL